MCADLRIVVSNSNVPSDEANALDENVNRR